MKTRILFGAAAVTFIASEVAASGFALARFGGEHGYAATSDPTALYYNPGALTLGENTQLMLDFAAAYREQTYTRDTSVNEPADAPGSNNGTATLSNFMAGPSAFAAFDFKPDGVDSVAVAFGAFAPFGGTASFDQNAEYDGNGYYPGAVDGPARWHNIDGQTLSLYLSGGAAVQMGPLSLGLALNAVRSSLETVRARTTTGDDSVAAEARSYVNVAGWQWSAGVGALLEAAKDELWIGLSYQSQPMQGTDTQMQLDGVLSNSFSETADAFLTQELPDVIRAAVRWKPSERSEIRVFGDYTRWSVFEGQCVGEAGKVCAVNADGSKEPEWGTLTYFPRDWNDAFGVRVGGSYWVTDPLELYLGVGYDSNAVPDETLDPAYVDGDDVSVAVGGSYAFSDHLSLSLAYTHMVFLDRDNRETWEVFDQSPARNPDGGGIYTHWVGIMNASLLATF